MAASRKVLKLIFCRLTYYFPFLRDLVCKKLKITYKVIATSDNFYIPNLEKKSFWYVRERENIPFLFCHRVNFTYYSINFWRLVCKAAQKGNKAVSKSLKKQ